VHSAVYSEIFPSDLYGTQIGSESVYGLSWSIGISNYIIASYGTILETTNSISTIVFYPT
jgi:hypothetical protein